MTDHSEIYCITMGKLLVIFHSHVVSHLDLIAVLHPRHKLDYFKKAGWEEEWIITAKKIVHDEFERSYMAPVIEDDKPSASDQLLVRCFLFSFPFYFNFTVIQTSTSSSKPFNIFYNLPSLAPPKASDLQDKLNRYLSTDPKDVENVLAWWHEQCGAYPQLSRMALDYLTIPGMF